MIGLASALSAQVQPRYRAFSPTTTATIYPTRVLAPGIVAVLGDSGKGAEGRPNAGLYRHSVRHTGDGRAREPGPG